MTNRSPYPMRSIFQFHKGAIRTHVAEQVTKEILNFNSIKVRLEHLALRLLQRRDHEFQFHKGAIRTKEKCNKQKIKEISIP